jgi:hypothetical protein
VPFPNFPSSLISRPFPNFSSTNSGKYPGFAQPCYNPRSFEGHSYKTQAIRVISVDRPTIKRRFRATASLGLQLKV